ncbi:hypothetical protein C8R44DRAFT_881040 [Mycena epipterygia]|nr:hypothetical protein C8R44DRAFT_881040 [Mycena epipterygia]
MHVYCWKHGAPTCSGFTYHTTLPRARAPSRASPSRGSPTTGPSPASVKACIFRCDGTPPVVKALSLDTNFDAVDWSKNGMVNIAIINANVPGAPSDPGLPPRAQRPLIGDGIKGAANDVKHAAESVGNKITSVARVAATEVKNVATAIRENLP